MNSNDLSKTKDYYIHISSDHNWFDLNLKEVWAYKDLIVLFTKRNFALTYKQTVLGPIWIFLRPLITSIMHALVFGGIAGIGTEGVPLLLFHLSGNALWGFFSACVSKNAGTFTTNAGVFGKVYFPRLTIPVSNVLSSIIQFGIQMLMVIAFLCYYLIQGSVEPNWAWWILIPGILIHLGIMGMGFGIIISSLTTKYRDLSILVGFGISLWMYATPVVYPLSTLEAGTLRTCILINPVTAPTELFRFALFGKGAIMPAHLVYSWAVTLAIALLGIMIFNKVERTFMDTV